MKTKFILLILILPCLCFASIKVGVGKAELTPPIGAPSAGYAECKGEGMVGIHDPLFAHALFIHSGEKQILFCSVDHLGFTHEMVQAITNRVHRIEGMENCQVYIGSSHTHSGGGGYLNIPVLGEQLAGKYNPEITEHYIEQTTEAIKGAFLSKENGKIGFGYGQAMAISKYRGTWPKDIKPLSNISVIKVTDAHDKPLAVLFNYPLHPTILKSSNRHFSADFVGYTRRYLEEEIGNDICALYFNGAQGDIIPIECKNEDEFDNCMAIGNSLGESVKEIWDQIKTKKSVRIFTKKESYAFRPMPTPFGLALPLNLYKSEMNIIVFDKTHAFLTIPGELSCIYDRRLKEIGRDLGYEHVSIFGLTNDAHGYIILPDSWRHKTFESALSFGGEKYGEEVENRAIFLLESARNWSLNFNDPVLKIK